MLTERIDNIKGDCILIAPLNWGLGHASRSSSIINELISRGKHVIIATDGIVADYFTAEYPGLEQVHLPGIRVQYSKSNSLVGAMLRQSPKFLLSIYREHAKLGELIDELNIDTVISDNRFGAWCNKCHCIYISHQLMIKMPPYFKWAEKMVWRAHKWFYNHYDEVWIPDNDDEYNLSGDLSHKYPISKKCHFIGVLSRFNNYSTDYNKGNISNSFLGKNSLIDTSKRFDDIEKVVIISGPEPARSMMESWALNFSSFNSHKLKTLIICGKPGNDNTPCTCTSSALNCNIACSVNTTGINSSGVSAVKIVNDYTLCVNHLPTAEIAFYLLHAREIVCRSGYSTIMDLYSLGILQNERVNISFIPTPGQTEQEYLALYIKQRFDNDDLNRINILNIN